MKSVLQPSKRTTTGARPVLILLPCLFSKCIWHFFKTRRESLVFLLNGVILEAEKGLYDNLSVMMFFSWHIINTLCNLGDMVWLGFT